MPETHEESFILQWLISPLDKDYDKDYEAIKMSRASNKKH